tara:strand:- start:226 stop:399 length:174 start_codon:yes stop_codon:yes gene_type:complete
MTIFSTESQEDGYFLGFSYNDETGKKAIVESINRSDAIGSATSMVSEQIKSLKEKGK